MLRNFSSTAPRLVSKNAAILEKTSSITTSSRTAVPGGWRPETGPPRKAASTGTRRFQYPRRPRGDPEPQTVREDLLRTQIAERYLQSERRANHPGKGCGQGSERGGGGVEQKEAEHQLRSHTAE